jgi:hypothetical protein
MRRPVGVTASAVVAILGSVFTLLFAGAAVASLFVAGAYPKPPNSAQMIVGSAVMFVVLAGIGIWTSIGLFHLRASARTSILVFASFLAAGSLLALLITRVVPKPPQATADTQNFFDLATAVMFGVPLAIAAWWLVQFNTQSTKVAFASPGAELESQRPISITIIAWVSLVGGLSSLIPVVGPTPAFLFGATFTGWTAKVIYAFFAALSLYIGKGLLDLRERARILAIALYGFSLVHFGVLVLLPSSRARLLEAQRGLEANQPNPIPFDEGMLMNVIIGGSVIAAAITVWFLFRNRPAFVEAETKRITSKPSFPV